ncbi:MAG: hypothetical protein DDT25_00590 [Chloroflexi bacterium]|nr:hypothetical protein [Chloroflexota bacterium]
MENTPMPIPGITPIRSLIIRVKKSASGTETTNTADRLRKASNLLRTCSILFPIKKAPQASMMSQLARMIPIARSLP